MPFTQKVSLRDDEKGTLEAVVKQFLSYYDELYETRIQKLIFYTEVYTITSYNRRVTRAEYKPYKYGAYSTDIRNTLEEMDGVSRRKTVRYGNRTVAYSLPNSSGEPINVDETREKIIEQIHKETQNTSTEDLAQFSKDSWLFDETEYNHPMQFEEFQEALEENPNIKEQLRRQLPERLNLSAEQLDSLYSVAESSL